MDLVWITLKRAANWIMAHPKSVAAAVVVAVIGLQGETLIEPITVPSDLGYDGRVAASRLAHHIRQFQDEARCHPEIGSLTVDPSALQLPSLSVGGMTIDPVAVVAMLQHYFKLSRQFIAGEVSKDEGGELVLTLRGSFGERVETVLVEAPKGSDPDDLLKEGARQFLEKVNPLLMAVYWSTRDPSNAPTVSLIHRVLSDGNPANDVSAYALWGWVLASRGEFENAYDKLDHAKTLSKSNKALVFEYWAWAFQLAGRPRDAEEKYRQALALSPRNPYSLNHLGLVLFQQAASAAPAERPRLLDQAQGFCEKAIAEHQLYAEAYELSAAIMCARDGAHHDRAARYARRAIDINPDHCPAYGTLARALRAQNAGRDAVIAALRRGQLRPKCGGDLGLLSELAWERISRTTNPSSQRSPRRSWSSDQASSANRTICLAWHSGRAVKRAWLSRPFSLAWPTAPPAKIERLHSGCARTSASPLGDAATTHSRSECATRARHHWKDPATRCPDIDAHNADRDTEISLLHRGPFRCKTHARITEADADAGGYRAHPGRLPSLRQFRL